MIKARISYQRIVMNSLVELADLEELEFKSATEMMKHVRARKKEIASECHYRYPNDVVAYHIELL